MAKSFIVSIFLSLLNPSAYADKLQAIAWFRPLVGHHQLTGSEGCSDLEVTLTQPFVNGYPTIKLRGKVVASWIGSDHSVVTETRFFQDVAGGGVDSPAFRNVYEFTKDGNGGLSTVRLAHYKRKRGFLGFFVRWVLERQIVCR